MKKVFFGLILSLGLCATVNAQVAPEQIKSNKVLTVQLDNIGGLYFLTFQNHTYLQLHLQIDCDGSVQEFDVGPYMLALQIPAGNGSMVTVTTTNVKSSQNIRFRVGSKG